MTPERWRRVKDIFDEAVERSAASRMAYVRDRCADDEALRREVESLLASDTQTGSLLDNPLMETGGGASAPSDEGAASPAPDDSFGPYVPVRLLGEGGMGTVYLARQQKPIRREVALKVVKLGMDSRQVLERFEIERQALALMDYPNIARVLDAGTSERGRPYFVMEYVEGVPVTQYCDGKMLSTRERLQLFIPVCHALQHAHKKGIIHRDVKPSNVLVTEVDGKAVPKIIDFGVARATEQRSAEFDAFTLYGQLIGTPEYMSPEQANLDNRDIDTGTDVYSLGVVLYELLVGVLPLDIKSLRKIALGEVLRAIRETPAPKPTARITEIGAAAEGLAQQRSTNLSQFRRELAGDLDSIVMKAIDKDRHCRYASASEFAADIERYLRNEPVLASPPARGYRIRKFVLRYRLYVAAAASIVFCLLLGLAASTAMYFKAASARREADRQRDIASHQNYVASIVAADLHIRSNENAEARRRLFTCPNPDWPHHGWEWQHLFLKTDFSLATLYTLGDSDYENDKPSLAFSSDGRRIYSSTQHTLYAWDTATSLPVGRWSDFGSILAVAPHAEKILSKVYTTGVAETDHRLRVFDPFSHRLIATFSGHQNEVTAAAFSPNGAYAVSGDRLGVLFVWDPVSGTAVRSLTPGEESVIAVEFSQDGKRIVAAFSDNTARLFDAATGVIIATPGRPARAGKDVRPHVIAVAFSPDSKRLAVSSSKSMRVVDTVSGRLQLEVNDFDWRIRSLSFAADGNRILAGADEGTVQIRDAGTGERLGNLIGHERAVRAISFHPSGQILTADGWKVRLWDPSSFGGVKTLTDQTGAVTSVAFAPNGYILASGSDDSTIRLWDASSGKLVSILKPAGAFQGFAFSPDSTYLASGSAMGAITIWDVTSGAQIRTLDDDGNRGVMGTPGSWRRHATSIAFSSDGRRIAFGSNDGIVRFWEVSTGRMLSKIIVSDPINSLDFSPDGHRIVTGTGDQQEALHAPAIRVWDVESGRLLVATKNPPGVPEALGNLARADQVVYSHDGKRLASLENGTDGPRIWDANSGQLLLQLKGPDVPNSPHSSIAFRADGRRVFGAYGNLVQIWDAESGEPLLLLHGHKELILTIALSADGSRLATGALDGTVKIWDTRSAYDPDAERTVQLWFNWRHFADEVMKLARVDPSLDETIRKALLMSLTNRTHVLLLAQQQGEHDPSGHLFAAWQAAKSPGAERAVYELALRHARVACDLAPWNWEAFNAQGAVQYRLGAHRDALLSLLHAAELRVRPSITNLALQALTYRGLGESGKARFALAEAKRLLDSPDVRTDQELIALVDEARSAVESASR